MLCGARLEQAWHHSRAHRFFSAARWSADQLGLVLLDLICALLVPDGAPVRLVVDDTPPRAVQRTVPFGLLCVSLVVCWYAQHSQPAADSPPTAPTRPGIAPSTPPPWLTRSTRSAVSYWPPTFCHLGWSCPTLEEQQAADPTPDGMQHLLARAVYDKVRDDPLRYYTQPLVLGECGARPGRQRPEAAG